MAIITSLEAERRGARRWIIELDELRWDTVPAELVRSLSLNAGDEVDPHQLRTAIDDALPEAAHRRALLLLNSRDRGSDELTERLIADGYPAGIARDEVDVLVSVGLVDDERYADSLVRSMAGSRGWGRRRIERELAERRLPPAVIAIALEAEAPPDEEADRARALAAKWARPGDRAERLAGRLARRGFAADVCWAAARAAIEGVPTSGPR
jgi:regulatory protein